MKKVILIATIFVAFTARSESTTDNATAPAEVTSLPPAQAAVESTQVSNPPAGENKPAWKFPITRNLGGYKLAIHAPQISDWENFTSFKALIAVVLSGHTLKAPLYATLHISGKTRVDLENRIVLVTDPLVDEVHTGGQASPDIEQLLGGAVRNDRLEIHLDLFLYALADDIYDSEKINGFNATPPRIEVRQDPTLLLFVNGKAVEQPIEETGLEIVANANWPIIHDKENAHYYLLYRQVWLESSELAGPWMSAREIPKSIGSISDEGEFANLAEGFPLKEFTKDVPGVLFTDAPTELIVTAGEPTLEEIPDTGGLQFVTNTQSPLFKFEDDYYFLASGRWFISSDLTQWRYMAELPEQFSAIPADHGMAYVRSSVAGTIEAKLAVLEAALPVHKEVEKTAVLDVEEQFDGEAKFEAVTDAGLSRAVNTPLHILSFQNIYYLCYEGAWYQAHLPTGPWTVTATVPQEIYNIPASSPSYAVTNVTVQESTPTTVTYNYTQGYSSGLYISYGVPVYGTGWYYPPYYGRYYYPWFVSYGYGSYYNPHSGRYTTRSVWQGPYGGYSYNRFSNPQTGRYGYVETAWDGDEWASYGESYNPRTRVYSETERYYNDDNQRYEMERDSYRDGKSMHTDREVDINDGWAVTTRQGSEGGSSVVESNRQADGSITREGTITAADGRTAEISGERNNGVGSTTITGSQGGEATVDRTRTSQGVSREGSYTNASGDSIEGSTKRDGYQTKSELTSSKGGEAVSISQGSDRTTVAKSGEGDLYASHNGNIYKKGEGGWSGYDPESGNWNQMENRERGASTSRASSGNQVQSRDWENYSSQMNRDATTRQNSYNQFNQRATRSSGGRSRSRGFGRRR